MGRSNAPVGVSTSHGHSAGGRRTPTYFSWQNMHARCKYPSVHSYPIYGGRGITVCARWEAFENFLADMGERPEGTSLDRIDSDGNYEPGNCRWSTLAEQNRNKRTGVKLTQEDVDWIRSGSDLVPIKLIAEALGCGRSTVADVVAGRSWR